MKVAARLRRILWFVTVIGEDSRDPIDDSAVFIPVMLIASRNS